MSPIVQFERTAITLANIFLISREKKVNRIDEILSVAEFHIDFYLEVDVINNLSNIILL